MNRSLIAATLLAFIFSTTVVAQVELKWKFRPGSTSTTTVNTNMKQILTIRDQDIETKNQQTIVASSTAGKRAQDGTLRVTTKVDSLKSKMVMPGGVDLSFDSTKPVEPQGTRFDMFLDLFKAVSKTASTTVYGKDNRVVAVEVDRGELDKLDDTLKTLIKDRYDPKYLKETANKAMEQIPSKPVKKGDTWALTQTMRLQGGQTLTFKSTFKYEGTIDRDGRSLDQISFAATDVKYAIDNPDAAAKVTKSELKIDSSKGVLLFDREKGQTVEENDVVHIKGDMTLSVGGQEIPAKLDLKFEKKKTVR